MLPVHVVAPNLREKNGNGRNGNGSSKKLKSFDAALKQAGESDIPAGKVRTVGPAGCYTVTYNANSEIQTFFYQQAREYTY